MANDNSATSYFDLAVLNEIGHQAHLNAVAGSLVDYLIPRMVINPNLRLDDQGNLVDRDGNPINQ